MAKAKEETHLISVAEWSKRSTLCRSTIYQMIARGEIPPPIKICPKRVAWPEIEYLKWLAACPRASLAELQNTEEDS